MEEISLLETGAAAALFAAVFVRRRSGALLSALHLEHRSVVSFSAGTAAAYVFVHVMPELHGARLAFASPGSTLLRYEGMAIYFVALLGFLSFFGLGHLREQQGAPDAAAAHAHAPQLGGFAAYVALVGYLLVRRLDDTEVSTALYAAAFAFHFLALDHALREEFGSVYMGFGRYLLAGAALGGWALGLALALPPYATALLLAFVSGGVIVNSAIAELPAARQGRLLPFVLGALVYGLLLLPLA